MKISNANVGPKKKNINPPIRDNKTDKIDKIITTGIITFKNFMSIEFFEIIIHH